MEWQPIESAPRDGTSVLTYPHFLVTHWEDDPEVIDQAGWVRDYDNERDIYRAIRHKITHWMPLPPPPK